MKKTLMSLLVWVCAVHATRQEVVEEIKQELERDGHKLVGGPWYLADDKDLSGMLGHMAVWGCGSEDGKWLWLWGKDGKWAGCYDKDGKGIEWYGKDALRLYKFDKDRAFSFDTLGDIRDLAQKLRDGKGLKCCSLMFYKDLDQLFKSWFEKVSCLYLDPRGVFFYIDQDIHTLEYPGCWTLNQAFFKASVSPEQMAEFQKQRDESERLKQEEARRQQKVMQGELELALEKHKAESAEREAKLEEIITTMGQQNATPDVLKELLSVTRKQAEDDKQELHLLAQRMMATISRQTGVINGIQEMIKSMVDRGSALPPELIDLVQNMHSADAAWLDRPV